MTTVDLSEPDRPHTAARRIAIATVAVLVYATILSLQIELPFFAAVSTAAVYVYTLALLLVPVRRWSRQLLESSRPVWQQFAAHALIAIAAVTLWQAVHVLFHRLVIGPEFWALVYAGSWLFQLLSAGAIYAATVGVSVAAMASARERERVRRQHELEVAARDAELAALKAQFQPHFVLNALNSLLALIDRDPALARTVVVRLADLMKSVFDRVDVDFVPLERELDLVRAYLDVERIRLGSRLSVAFDIDDAARGVLVPPFLLQPVVENAVKHGVAPFTGSGRVEIEAMIADRRLRVVVRDRAPRTTRSPQTPIGTGRGLQITRRRLDGAYGDHYEMHFSPHADGATVEIVMPAERPGAA